MRFNFFGGSDKFVVQKKGKIHIYLSNQNAFDKINKQGIDLFYRDIRSNRYGTLVILQNTILELLAYSKPMFGESHSIKVKLNFNNTIINKVGIFYLYTTIQSLENIDLEPC